MTYNLAQIYTEYLAITSSDNSRPLSFFQLSAGSYYR